MAISLSDLFKSREELLQRLDKCLQRVEPKRHIPIVTSWMSEDDFRKMVEFLETQL